MTLKEIPAMEDCVFFRENDSGGYCCTCDIITIFGYGNTTFRAYQDFLRKVQKQMNNEKNEDSENMGAARGNSVTFNDLKESFIIPKESRTLQAKVKQGENFEMVSLKAFRYLLDNEEGYNAISFKFGSVFITMRKEEGRESDATK